MNTFQIEAIRTSFDAVSERSEDFADRFYARLFAMQPMLRAILPRDHWQRERDLIAAVGMMVKGLGKLDSIQYPLMDFGAKAERTGISPHQYGLARQALVSALRETLDTQWSDDLEDAWTEALNTVASVVVLGAGRSRARAA